MWRILFGACFVFTVGATGATATDKGDSIIISWKSPDTIIVTANRFGLSREQSVWPVSIIPLKALDARSSLDEALDGKGGMDIRNSSGLGSVSTLSNWGVFNRHMLLLYNGRVVKDYSLGGFNLSEFSVEEMERLEILKGPQSAFYGSDAVGGVVNLISKSSLIDRMELTTLYGSSDLRHYHLDLARKVGAVGVGAFVEFASTDNRRPNAGMQHTIIGVRSDYLSVDSRHRLSFSARYFDDSLGAPGPVPDPRSVPVYGDKESSSLTAHQQDKNYSFDTQYRFFDKRIGEFQLDLFWEKKNLDFKSLFKRWYDSADVYSTSIYNKRSSGVNARFMKDLDALFAAGGIDWLSGSLSAPNIDSIVVGTGPDSDTILYNFWSARQNQFDMWGNVGLQAVQPVRIDLSGRLQFVRNRQTQPSYNVGLVYTPAIFLELKFGYGYAFRLPTIAEQFADDTFTKGNLNLSPETARTLQGTVMVNSTDKTVSIALTVFHQEIDSLVQYRYDPTIFRSLPRNVERFKSTGLDASLYLKAGHNLSAQWNGVMQNAEQSLENGREMIDAYYVPEIKWRADLDGSFALFKGNVNITYTSDRTIILFDGSRKDITKVYELGMGVGLRVDKHLYLSLTGYDLTDQRRPDQFGFTTGDGDYPSLGRRFVLEARFSLL